MNPFSVQIAGSFHTLELLDSNGRQVFNLADAVEAANETYGNHWIAVYNGEVGEENLNQRVK